MSTAEAIELTDVLNQVKDWPPASDHPGAAASWSP